MSRPSIVRIRLKKGNWEVEIECEESKVKETIESVLSGLSAVPEATSERSEKPRGALTCRDLIENLWTEGWFSTAKSLGDVHDELARRGYHYDRTAVSHSLAELVRENMLTRLGTQRNYRYVQKKPPLGAG
ncbi:MAG: hypothetical protein H3Z52_04120 [archaeon]|nr:hypothetical protein [archaeon]MCP8317955.1 hypothetical protein [archaeon]MCP8320117.1 hypothetical protein [archaeon]